MRILHVTIGMRVGGIERLIHDLAPVQIERGHQVRVLAVSDIGPFGRQLQADGVAVDCLNMPRLRGRAFQLGWRVRRYLLEHRIEAVIEHGALDGIIAVAAASARVQYMCSVIHNTYRLRIQSKRRLYHRLYRRYYRWLVAVSESVRQFEIEHYGLDPNEVRVIPNGIVVSRFRRGRAGPNDRARLLGRTLDKDTVVVGTVGNLRAQKNHALLLRAWHLVTQHVARPLLLVIAGDGLLRGELERQKTRLGLDDSVLLLGSRSDIPDVLMCFDVFAMSSRHEGQPIVALEAMASELPVVAMNVPGLRDVVREVLERANVSTIHALCAAIERLILDSPMRLRMGRQGGAMVDRESSIERCASDYEEVLLTSSHRRGKRH